MLPTPSSLAANNAVDNPSHSHPTPCSSPVPTRRDWLVTPRPPHVLLPDERGRRRQTHRSAHHVCSSVVHARDDQSLLVAPRRPWQRLLASLDISAHDVVAPQLPSPATSSRQYTVMTGRRDRARRNYLLAMLAEEGIQRGHRIKRERRRRMRLEAIENDDALASALSAVSVGTESNLRPIGAPIEQSTRDISMRDARISKRRRKLCSRCRYRKRKMSERMDVSTTGRREKNRTPKRDARMRRGKDEQSSTSHPSAVPDAITTQAIVPSNPPTLF